MFIAANYIERAHKQMYIYTNRVLFTYQIDLGILFSFKLETILWFICIGWLPKLNEFFHWKYLEKLEKMKKHQFESIVELRSEGILEIQRKEENKRAKTGPC